MFISILLISVLSGILYRLGGMAKTGYWFDFIINTKARDFGVPLCLIILMILMRHVHWSLFLCFGLTFAFCTTYFKPKGTDATLLNWMAVGLALGLGMLPYCIFNGYWFGFIFRSLLCCVSIGLWSALVGNAWLEEFGRGFIVAATLPFLFM